MKTPKVAIIKLRHRTKTQKWDQERARSWSDILQSEEKGILGSVDSLWKELQVMKAQIKKLKRERMAFDPKKNNNKRNVDLKKNMAELEQYYRR